MSKIEDEAYSELCQENERLKLEIHNEKQYAADVITTYRCEADDMKALLGRAADALEFWMKDLASTEQQYVDAAMRHERLLSELREAAE